jgi:hypothetical protein
VAKLKETKIFQRVINPVVEVILIEKEALHKT